MNLFEKDKLEYWQKIDPQHWKEIANGIIDVFSSVAPQDFALFKIAAKKRDCRVCSLIAHRLQSSYAHVGGERLQDLFSRIEIFAESMQWEQVDNTIHEIEALKGPTHKLIENFRRDHLQ